MKPSPFPAPSGSVSGCAGMARSVTVGRREALRVGGLGLLGTTLPHLLEGRAASAEVDAPGAGMASFGRAKRVIFLYMWGGPAQQDTFDPKPDAPVEYRGEFKPIATSVPGLSFCEHLPHLAARAHQFALIRSVTHSDVNHTTASHDMLCGQPFRTGSTHRDTHPNVATVLAHLGRHGRGVLPPAVNFMPVGSGDAPRFVEETMGQGAGWLGPVYDPMRIDEDPATAEVKFGGFRLHGDLTPARVDDRRRLLAEVDAQAKTLESRLDCQALSAHYRRAYDLLTAPKALEAFRLDREPDVLRDRYGRNPHGQCVLMARRLAEAGVPMTTVFWQSDGIKNVSVYWDTHNRNFIDLKTRLLPYADAAFAALLDDLQDRGLLDETLVVWTGEFGRTPRVGQGVVGGAGAGADGRDHWPGVFTSVLAGGGVKGGAVYGESDRYAAYPKKNPVRPADLVATIYHCLGVSPHTMLRDRLDRPIPLCHGTPLYDVLL
ncbi:MAG: DUF1501 domain-containing protein [Planctomycetia bacterium]